ncbi:hypothetical protein ULO1_28000, partial [Carboxydocella sp. ULO1]
NTKCLGEYFAEGYRIFALHPELLKKKDRKLFDFIKRLGENE